MSPDNTTLDTQIEEHSKELVEKKIRSRQSDRKQQRKTIELRIALAAQVREYFRYMGKEPDIEKQATKLRRMTGAWCAWIKAKGYLPDVCNKLFPDQVNHFLDLLTKQHTHATEQLPEQPAGDADTVRQLPDRDAAEIRGVPQAESTDLRNLQEDSEPSDQERPQEPECGVHI